MLGVFQQANGLRPLLVYGVRAVQELPGTLLPDERLFIVYSKPAIDCVHAANKRIPASVKDMCGFDRVFDIEDVAASLVDRTSLSYDVFRADKWARVYYFDELLTPMATRSRSRDGKYEMYNPKVLGDSYLQAFDHWKNRLDNEFDPDLFLDATRMLLTSGKLVEHIKSNSGVPQLVPLRELMTDTGQRFADVVMAARDEWAQGLNIPAKWDDLPFEISDAMREKRNEQIMILNAARGQGNGAEPYPKELVMRLYAEFVFALHDAEQREDAQG